MQKITTKQPILNKAFLFKRCFFLFLISCYVTSFANDTSNKNYQASSVTFTVSGKVTDSKGVGLSGATIVEKGMANGTSSTADGSFSINVKGEKAILVISYVGYTTKEVEVGGSTSNLVVKLTSEDASLQTIIVIGYGTQKKLSSTAAISSVKGEELAKAPVANISNSLAGRVSGVIMNANRWAPWCRQSEYLYQGYCHNRKFQSFNCC